MDKKKPLALAQVLNLATTYELRTGVRLLFESKMPDAERIVTAITLMPLLAAKHTSLARGIIRLFPNSDRAYLWWRLYVNTKAKADLNEAEASYKLYLPHQGLRSRMPDRDALASALVTCAIKEMTPSDIGALRRGLNDIKHDDLRQETAVLVGLAPAPKPEMTPIYDAATREGLLTGYRTNIETLLAKASPEPWLVLNDLGEIALLGATNEATAALESGSKIAAKIKLKEVPDFVDYVYMCAIRGVLNQRNVAQARSYADKIRSPGTKAIAYVRIGLAVSTQRSAN